MMCFSLIHLQYVGSYIGIITLLCLCFDMKSVRFNINVAIAYVKH